MEAMDCPAALQRKIRAQKVTDVSVTHTEMDRPVAATESISLQNIS